MKGQFNLLICITQEKELYINKLNDQIQLTD